MRSHQDKPDQRDIVLFKNTSHCTPTNVVKTCLNYLKFCQLNGPYRFSSSCANSQLIESLTLRENLYLDAIPLSLVESRDLKFRQHLNQTQNKYLGDLLEQVTELDVLPSRVDQRSRKIIGLIKTLLQDCDFLFYESPENHLEKEDFETFIKALQFTQGKDKKIAFIFSQEQTLWMDFATKTVTRDQFNCFQTQSVNRHTVQKKFLSQTIDHRPEVPTDELVFHLPHALKKSA